MMKAASGTNVILASYISILSILSIVVWVLMVLSTLIYVKGGSTGGALMMELKEDLQGLEEIEADIAMNTGVAMEDKVFTGLKKLDEKLSQLSNNRAMSQIIVSVWAMAVLTITLFQHTAWAKLARSFQQLYGILVIWVLWLTRGIALSSVPGELHSISEVLFTVALGTIPVAWAIVEHKKPQWVWGLWFFFAFEFILSATAFVFLPMEDTLYCHMGYMKSIYRVTMFYVLFLLVDRKSLFHNSLSASMMQPTADMYGNAKNMPAAFSDMLKEGGWKTAVQSVWVLVIPINMYTIGIPVVQIIILGTISIPKLMIKCIKKDGSFHIEGFSGAYVGGSNGLALESSMGHPEDLEMGGGGGGGVRSDRLAMTMVHTGDKDSGETIPMQHSARSRPTFSESSDYGEFPTSEYDEDGEDKRRRNTVRGKQRSQRHRESRKEKYRPRKQDTKPRGSRRPKADGRRARKKKHGHSRSSDVDSQFAEHVPDDGQTTPQSGETVSLTKEEYAAMKEAGML